MIKELQEKIREPFWSAGQKYGWIGAGVGLSKKYFIGMELDDILKFKVQITKKTLKEFQITFRKAKSLYDKYKAKMIVKNGEELVIFPIEELDS